MLRSITILFYCTVFPGTPYEQILLSTIYIQLALFLPPVSIVFCFLALHIY